MKLLKKSNRLVIAVPTRELATDVDTSSVSPSFHGEALEPSSLDRWIVIGVSTSLCFAKTLRWEGRRKKFNQRELAYLLESYVPVNAEELAVEIISAPKQGFIVGINARELKDSLTTELPEWARTVCVCPAIFLAVPEILLNCGEARSLLAMIFGEEGSDVLILQQGKILAWRWIDCRCHDREDLLHQVDEFGIDTIALYGVPQVVEHALRQRLESSIDAGALSIVGFSSDLEQAILKTAERVATGLQAAPVNLLSGPLAPKSGHPVLGSAYRVALVALVSLFILIIGAIFVRSYRYESAIAELEEQQTDLFKEVFPNQPIPVGISNRLRSELRLLAGEKGSTAPLVPSISGPLESWLAALPEQTTYQIDRVDFRSNAIAAMTGSTSSYEELGLLWQNLKAAGFIMPRPSATQTKGRISIRLEEVPFATSSDEIRLRDGAGG